VSLQQAAFAVTIIAGLISAILGAIKLHDRIRYGRVAKGD
jgi:phage terminase Nu1 subunit (DNA packaging protein)